MSIQSRIQYLSTNYQYLRIFHVTHSLSQLFWRRRNQIQVQSTPFVGESFLKTKEEKREIHINKDGSKIQMHIPKCKIHYYSFNERTDWKRKKRAENRCYLFASSCIMSTNPGDNNLQTTIIQYWNPRLWLKFGIRTFKRFSRKYGSVCIN